VPGHDGRRGVSGPAECRLRLRDRSDATQSLWRVAVLLGSESCCDLGGFHAGTRLGDDHGLGLHARGARHRRAAFGSLARQTENPLMETYGRPTGGVWRPSPNERPIGGVWRPSPNERPIGGVWRPSPNERPTGGVWKPSPNETNS